MVKALALVLTAMLITAVNAETTLGVFNDLKTGSQYFDLFAQKNYSDKVGGFVYAMVSDGWSEAYAGPTFSPTANSQVGLGLGFESGQKSARVGGYAWVGQGKASLLYLYEYSGSGPWHKLKASYQVSKRASVMILEKSSIGLGVGTEVKLDANTSLVLESFGNKASRIAVMLKL